MGHIVGGVLDVVIRYGGGCGEFLVQCEGEVKVDA